MFPTRLQPHGLTPPHPQDTFADARQNDVQNLAEEMEEEVEHDRKALGKLFARIDKDGSGQLTLNELISGAAVLGMGTWNGLQSRPALVPSLDLPQYNC